MGIKVLQLCATTIEELTGNLLLNNNILIIMIFDNNKKMYNNRKYLPEK